MVKIQGAIHLYKRSEIFEMGLIIETDSHADDPRKTRDNKKLESLIRIALNKTPILQWIDRQGFQLSNFW